jgi:sigma-B regulation protein RsbU (phosphoserine phosphatase)
MVCRNGETHRIQAEGVPLGLLPDRDYDEVVFQAQPDDLIVLYSDGVSDHLDPAGNDYGRNGLAHVVKRSASLPPDRVIQEIFTDLDRFNTERFDDQTLIVMRVTAD